MDQRVRELLSDAADGVRAVPDPSGRLRARQRRARRRRVTAAGLGLVAVIAIGGWAGLPAGPGHGEGGGVSDFDRMQQWAERLRVSPVRGGLADADPGYVQELARLVLGHQRAGAFRITAEVTEVNVLFLDDIGDVRVAFVAFHRAVPDPTTQWINASAWFMAPRGAAASELADPRAEMGTGDGLSPFEVTGNFGTVDLDSAAAIALVPDGCVIETAALPALDDWTPAQTGSYLVRTRATERPEWWRAVCDGVVREETAARQILPTTAPTDEQVDAAVAGARGGIDRDAARFAMGVGESLAYGSGPLTVVWGGRIEDPQPGDNVDYDDPATMVAYPAARGGWQVSVGTWSTGQPVEGEYIGGGEAWLSWDPTTPSAIVPVRLDDSDSFLVVTPPGTSEVRSVAGGRTIDTAAVTDAAAVVRGAGTADVVLEALDAAGTVIGTVPAPADRPTDHHTAVGW
ncbi:hypothetical protein [Asanoa iriomotensis]|uniref:hypothetical protein n=1 Tax=Asanoa iriomotensis TaxID=234613 RepID=UPI001943F4F8|nr:hypothetical protein [Asanoa iriomotensis]